jgi:hypothetical protein
MKHIGRFIIFFVVAALALSLSGPSYAAQDMELQWTAFFNSSVAYVNDKRSFPDFRSVIVNSTGVSYMGGDYQSDDCYTFIAKYAPETDPNQGPTRYIDGDPVGDTHFVTDRCGPFDTLDLLFDDQENVYLTYGDYDPDFGLGEFFWGIRKYDGELNLLWERRVDSPLPGGAMEDWFSTAVDGSGNLYLGGNTHAYNNYYSRAGLTRRSLLDPNAYNNGFASFDVKDNGVVYFASYTGAYRHDLGSNGITNATAPLPHGTGSRIAADHAGNAYVGVRDTGYNLSVAAFDFSDPASAEGQFLWEETIETSSQNAYVDVGVDPRNGELVTVTWYSQGLQYVYGGTNPATASPQTLILLTRYDPDAPGDRFLWSTEVNRVNNTFIPARLIPEIYYVHPHPVFDNEGRIYLFGTTAEGPDSSNLLVKRYDPDDGGENLGLLPDVADSEVVDDAFLSSDDKHLYVTGFANSWDVNRPYLLKYSKGNQPPVACFNTPVVEECTNAAATTVTLDASCTTDPDNDPLTYEWFEDSVSLGTGLILNTPLPLGTHTITLDVFDGEFLVNTTGTATVEDTTPPATSAEFSGTEGLNNWYVDNDVTVDLTATDSCSGVKEVHYSVNGVETVVPGDIATFIISNAVEGIYNTPFWAVDNWDVPEDPNPLTIKLDTSDPAQPVNVREYPIDEKGKVSLTPTLEASPYSDEHPQFDSHWQICDRNCDNDNPDDVVMETLGGPQNTVDFSLTIHNKGKQLDENERYFWRVKYQDQAGKWSEWSASTDFTTVK